MGLGRAGGNPRKQGCRRELFENILIVTDGEKTETNYFQGLKNSFPEEKRHSRLGLQRPSWDNRLFLRNIAYKSQTKHPFKNFEIPSSTKRSFPSQ